MIIPLMQEDAVHVYHWMSDAQFLNAVALGQVTPGPVVATVAAVGYAAHGLAEALLAAAVAFTPSFSFILLGGGRFERLRGNDRARAIPGWRRAGGDRSDPRLCRHPRGRLDETWQIPVLAAAAISLLLVRRGVVETLVGAGAVGVVVALAGASGALGWIDGGGHRNAAVPEGLGPSGGRAARAADPDQHRQSARQRGPGPGVPAGGSLTDAGFECEQLAAEPGRPNLVARLRGTSDGPTLTFLGHVDTVRADPDEWSFDPWAGDVADGSVRGRGALDMKGQVASEVAAAVTLAESGWRPPARRAAAGDHRRRGGRRRARRRCGSARSTRTRPCAATSSSTRAAGTWSGSADRRLYTLSVGEKGIFRMRLRTHGKAGHASLPRIGDNALLKLAGYLAALSEQPPPEATDVGEALLEALIGEPFRGEEGVRAGLERLRAEEPLIADYLVEPMLGVTLTPTKAEAGKKANVIPVRGRGPDRLPRAARARARTTRCASSPR